MRKLKLDILQKGLPGITPIMGAYYMEAAIVSLMKNGHTSGVILAVNGDYKLSCEISWEVPVDNNIINSWKEEKVSTAHGAVGIALCLLLELFDYTTFEEGIYGTGIDFWLGKGELANNQVSFFQREARVEISGIFKETKENSINMRVNKKKKQISSSDKTKLDGWVIVVEFETPKSKIVKK